MFTFGKLANERIKLTSDNEQPAVLLIDQFFKQIEAELASGHNQLREKLSDPARLIEGIQQRDDAIRKNDYISGLLKFEYGLYDSGYPLSKDHLHLLVEIYRTCGLHVAELVYLESRVNNSLS